MTQKRNDGNVTDKDEARTPPSLFKKLDDRFHFDVDLCANRHNTLCQDYYSNIDTKHSGLLIGDRIVECHGNMLIDPWYIASYYCNPPYSNPEPFIKKAAEESLKGSIIVMLLPTDTSTIAFMKYIMGYDNKNGVLIPNGFGASEVIFIQPRVKFNNPDGTPMNRSPTWGSMVVVFKNEVFDGSPIISCMDWR